MFRKKIRKSCPIFFPGTISSMERLRKIFLLSCCIVSILLNTSKAQVVYSNLMLISKFGSDFDKDGISDETALEVYQILPDFSRPEIVWKGNNFSGESFIYLVESGDFNGDGFGDIVIAEHLDGGVNGNHLRKKSHLTILSGSSFEKLWEISENDPDKAFYLIQKGDFNGDNFSDLVVVNGKGKDKNRDGLGDNYLLRIYKGGPNGLDDEFSNPWFETSEFGKGDHALILETGDYNGDGRDDLAALHYPKEKKGTAESPELSIYTWESRTHAFKVSRTIWPSTSNPLSSDHRYMLCTGNFNGDQFDDLVVVTQRNQKSTDNYQKNSSAVAVLYGSSNLNIRISNIAEYSRNEEIYMIDSGDFNQDEFDDLVIVQHRKTGPDLSVFPGSLTGIQINLPMWELHEEHHYTLLETGDFNGDHYDDIAIVRRSGAGEKNTFLRIFDGKDQIAGNNSNQIKSSGTWEIQGNWDGKPGSSGKGHFLIGKLNNKKIIRQNKKHPRLFFTEHDRNKILSNISASQSLSRKWHELREYVDQLVFEPNYMKKFDEATLMNYSANIIALSFCRYFLEGNDKKPISKKAINYFRVFVEGYNDFRRTIINSKLDGVTKQVLIGIYLEALSIGYDWLYDTLDGIQKRKIERYLFETALALERLNTNWNDFVYSNHTIWHAVPVLFAGIVLPEDMGDRFLIGLKQKTINRMFVALEEMSGEDGGWHESPTYYMVVALPRIAQFCEAWRVAMKENLFTGQNVNRSTHSLLQDGFGFLQHAGEFISFHTTPDKLFMRTGDIGQTSAHMDDFGAGHIGLPLYGYTGSYFLQLIANRIRKQKPRLAGYAQWYAKNISNNLDNSQHSKNYWNKNNIRRTNHIYSLLWQNDEVDEVSPYATLTKHFKGIGHVIMRSDTGENPVIVKFECGDFFNNHNHSDQNSFTIYYSGNLAIDAGYYGKGSGAYKLNTPEGRFQLDEKGRFFPLSWPNYHQLNFAWRTVAHNSILVFRNPDKQVQRPDQQDQPFIWKYGNRSVQLIDDGGQYFANETRRWSDRNDPKYERGNIEFVWDSQDGTFSIIRGDAASAYINRNPGGIQTLKTFLRDLVFIRPHKNDPNVFIILFDKIITNPSLNRPLVSWVMNYSERAMVKPVNFPPEENMVEIILTNESFPFDRSRIYRGKLFLKRLYPRPSDAPIKLKKNFEVGSFASDITPPHFRFVGEKVERNQEFIAYIHPDKGRDIGGDRIEINTPGNGKEQFFLNVLFPADWETKNMPPTSIIESPSVLGSYIQSSEYRHLAVVFNKHVDASAISYKLSPKPNISIRHIISHLLPYQNYQVRFQSKSKDWQILGNYETSSEGIIDFFTEHSNTEVTFEIKP